MFTFEQQTGVLRHNGEPLATCYSGHGEGVNNPALQQVRDVGPIPAGKYTIGPEFIHPRAGAVCMRLTPLPSTDTFGRSGFLMHGDNRLNNRSASEGCIIAPRPARIVVAEVAARGDNLLEVTP